MTVAQEAFWNLLSVHSSWKYPTALLVPLFLKGHQRGLFWLHLSLPNGPGTLVPSFLCVVDQRSNGLFC